MQNDLSACTHSCPDKEVNVKSVIPESHVIVQLTVDIDSEEREAPGPSNSKKSF